MNKCFSDVVRLCLAALLASMLPGAVVRAGQENGNALANCFAPVEFHGFVETRAGSRLQDDPVQKDISAMDARLQAELFTYAEWADFKYKGDAWLDGVTEQGEYDTREAWLFSRPSGFLDLKVGRQVLTWGTGDLVFLNDLFPKDWQSYFIGRDKEYLKAPSDAAKISLFSDTANIDIVYTPKFDPDRYVTGEYVSYWDPGRRRYVGRDDRMASDEPDRWFRDDELAVRLYRNVRNYELALYGYRGFWKKPAGQSPSGEAMFPQLHAYGFSARGQAGPGIGNVEVAYYQSRDDESGENERIDNSEVRYLAGYAQDLAKDFNGSVQFYVEQILNYGKYRESLSDGPARDRARMVLTLQLTRLAMNQNLELALSSYWSPTDRDCYIRPAIRYKYSDQITLETGANIFSGKYRHTFFGRFENNTNAYVSVRYGF